MLLQDFYYEIFILILILKLVTRDFYVDYIFKGIKNKHCMERIKRHSETKKMILFIQM